MSRLAFAMLWLLLFVGAARADKTAARAAYREAVKHYDLNEFQTALESFKRAYLEFEEPALLFNIAQCHRQLGDRPAAIQFYRSYLRRLPEAPNREAVTLIIANLEAALVAERASRAAPPTDVIDVTRPTRSEPPPTPPAVAPAPSSLVVATSAAVVPRIKRRWLWGVVGGGAALVVTAVALGVAFGVSAPRASATFGNAEGN